MTFVYACKKNIFFIIIIALPALPHYYYLLFIYYFFLYYPPIIHYLLKKYNKNFNIFFVLFLTLLILSSIHPVRNSVLLINEIPYSRKKTLYVTNMCNSSAVLIFACYLVTVSAVMLYCYV